LQKKHEPQNEDHEARNQLQHKRTGSLSKLQKAMGHSSLAVSLTYLRGLEVSELEESDMPMV